MADPSRSSYAPHSPNLSHYSHGVGDSVHERYRYHPYQRQQSQSQPQSQSQSLQQQQQQSYYRQYPGQYQSQPYQQPQITSYTQQQQQQSHSQSRQHHQQDEQQMQFQKYYPPEQQSSQARPVPAPAPAPEPQTRYHSSTMPLYPQPTKNQQPHQAPAFPSTYQANAGSGPGSSYSSQVPSYTSNFAIPQNSATASYGSPSVAAPASPTSTYNRNHGPSLHQVAGQGPHLNSHPHPHPHSHSHSQSQPQPQPQPQSQPQPQPQSQSQPQPQSQSKPQAHPHSYQQPQFHHQASSSPPYDSSLQSSYTQQLQSQPRQLAGASSHSHPKPEDLQSASHALHVSQPTTVQPIKVEERSPTSIASAQMPPRRAAAAAAAAAIKNDEDTEEEILTLPEPLHDAPIEPSPVKTKFPTARIKRIMQADEEVGKVAQQAPIAVGKALELFMVALVSKSADVARERGQKRITTAMMKQVIETDDQWDFLRDISAKVDTEEKPSRVGRAPKQEASDTEDENPEPKKRGRGRKKKVV